MMYGYGDYYDDHSSYNSQDSVALRRARLDYEEVYQDAADVDQAVEQEEARRREDAQNRANQEMARFRRQQTQLDTLYIQRSSKLSLALEMAKADNSLVVFARDRPRLKEDMRIKYTKQYLVGSLPRFFRYASTEQFGVSLHEVARADRHSRLHFDVEIKQLETGNLVVVEEDKGDLCDILAAHMAGLGLATGLAQQLAAAFKRVAILPLSEEECRHGFQVVRDHIRTMMHRFIPNYNGVEPGSSEMDDMKVVSGCRAAKFSMHAVMPWVYCDSPALAMPLVVFEIARAFVVDNLEKLVNWPRGPVWEGSHEGVFRLRAMMLDTLASGKDGDGNVCFKGYNDCPFDEAIYSANHLLRAPGACKPDTKVYALAPVTAGSQMIVNSHEFPFAPDDSGMADWNSHLISAPKPQSLRQLYVFTRWKPLEAYPKKRAWYADNAKLSAAVALGLEGTSDLQTIVTGDGPFTMPFTRYKEARKTQMEQRHLTNVEFMNATNHNIPLPRSVVMPDDLFQAEEGGVKAFRYFRPGEFICHEHAGVVERTASAKVFQGGFHCFGCNTTYAVPRSRPWEPPYPFEEAETTTKTDPGAYLDEINWRAAREKKFLVVSAPMGSGKTEQVKKLVDLATSEKKSVCVLSFRRFLAKQQAQRLMTFCYLDDTNVDQNSFLAHFHDQTPPEARAITICLNSLYKLSRMAFDYVVLDECGLIRRHFLSTTVTEVLGKVYERFTMLIREASFVVMLQDGVSLEDINFYTDICSVPCDDRRQVSAIQLKKPLVIHPIRYTTNIDAAVHNMLQCYSRSVQDGMCSQPFMVFTSNARKAEWLVEILKEEAEKVGGDPARIKGIWSAVKEADPFCDRFADNPNDAALETDVVVCTSVIGAGFSISTHFYAFHAFLFTRILSHNEEQQFIRRLRFVMENIPENAIRQSYLYIEKANALKDGVDYASVLRDFGIVRKVLLEAAVNNRPLPNIVSLEETQARIAAEMADTNANHDQRWIDWGGGELDSEFTELQISQEQEDKDARLALKNKWNAWCRARTVSIGTLVQGSINTDSQSEAMSVLEGESVVQMFRQVQADQHEMTLKKAFVREDVAVALIGKQLGGNSNEIEKFLGNPTRISNHILNCRRLACWISWSYRHIKPADAAQSPWTDLGTRQYKHTTLRMCSNLELCKVLMEPLFICLEPDRPSYLMTSGCTPFFTGAEFLRDDSLCRLFRNRLIDETSDDDATRKHKQQLQSHYRTFTGKHDAQDRALTAITEDPKEAWRFARKLLNSVGIKFHQGNRRGPPKRDREGNALRGEKVSAIVCPKDVFASILALKDKFAEPVRQILPTLLNTPNLCDADKEWMRESIQIYVEACAECGALSSVPLNLSLPRGRLHPVTAARLAESRIEQEHGGFEHEQDHPEAEAEAAEQLASLREHADSVDRDAALCAEQRRLQEALRQEEPEDHEDDDWEDDGPPIPANPFIHDEADEES